MVRFAFYSFRTVNFCHLSAPVLPGSVCHLKSGLQILVLPIALAQNLSKLYPFLRGGFYAADIPSETQLLSEFYVNRFRLLVECTLESFSLGYMCKTSFSFQLLSIWTHVEKLWQSLKPGQHGCTPT